MPHILSGGFPKGRCFDAGPGALAATREAAEGVSGMSLHGHGAALASSGPCQSTAALKQLSLVVGDDWGRAGPAGGWALGSAPRALTG